MTNINFIKTLTAGFALAMAICSQSLAADSGNCGTNCRYDYDSATQTITFSVANPNDSTPAIINKTMLGNRYGLSGVVENVVIAEGIKEIHIDGGLSTIRFDGVGGGTGKLTLPESLTNIGSGAFWSLGFSNIEINSKNLNVSADSIAYNGSGDRNPQIILSADANVFFADKTFYNEWANSWYLPNGVNIACKGKPDTCLAKFGNALNGMNQNNIHADYYRATDADGNVIQYHDTGYYKYDSQGNLLESWNLAGDEQYDEKGNVIAKYDTDGNLRWALGADGSAYWYDANGKITGAKKTSPFTPAEAAALIKKGNVNKVTLTFK